MRKNKNKKKKAIFFLVLIPLIIILFLFGWFLTIVFEGEKPLVALEPLPEFLSGGQKFTFRISDAKRGLKKVQVSANQEGRKITLVEKKFPFEGFLNRGGVRIYEQEIFVDPAELKLSQGRVDLLVSVWDYSRRGGGDGNMAVGEHKMIVDTIPPALRSVSRMHNINKGGSGLVIYQTSSDTEQSGVYVDDLFFSGFPVDAKSQEGLHVCYFALPYFSGLNPSIYLWAKDKAGNRSRTTFYHHIRKKRFRRERINITDRFLKRVLPYFSFYPLNSEDSDIKKYLKINNDLRTESHQTFYKLREDTTPKRLWEGSFLRLKNAATMSRFADQRLYYYKGKKVDEQVHLGIDLASLANSPIQAANNGRVVFAERNGIYGLAVVLDHGQGLATLYAHLNAAKVTPNQEVKKGDIIGYTGQTGLAGGDHLHFGLMVNGVAVNPIEWWDGHWINDNIHKKLAILGE
ncbi:MAG: M23 family metallopeptidase [Desulfobacteraceae bacterium]|jgi:murein DD-endopeptidase MepM/ murein hydrolase activator NlpD